METNNKDSRLLVAVDRKSKALFLVFGFAVIASIAFSFLRFVVFRDYIIEAQTDCDSAVESCFVWECDPESEEEGEMCTGNPEEDVWHYKIIRKNAMNIPLCDPNDEGCQPMACMEGEPECGYELCVEGNEAGLTCSSAEKAEERDSLLDVSIEETIAPSEKADEAEIPAVGEGVGSPEETQQ